MFRKAGRWGFTLLEVSLTAGLLSLLMLLHLGIFRSAASSWHKVEGQAGLLQQLQIAGDRWSRECRQSSTSGLELGAEAMALPSPLGAGGGPGCDPYSGLIVWRRSDLFYRDPVKREFLFRKLNWPDSGTTSKPLDQIDFGSGLQSLGFYRNGGEVQAREVDLAEFTRRGNSLQLRLSASQKRYGKEALEVVELRVLASPRNP